MPTTCEIDFENNPEKVLYAGQLLRGTIKLSLTSEKTVRGIYILIVGRAYCHWTKGSGKNRKSYTGSEDYLEEKTYLYGDENGDYRLLPGTYSYTFQTMLPPALPTSVEANIGYIRYLVRLVVDIPMAFDKEFEVPFTVIKAVNLNAIPALREPAIAETQKTFFLCFLLCCSSDPMKLTARTPVGGYTPGQVINLEIDVINQSDQPVSDFTVQLIKTITYFTHANSSRSTYEKIVITEEDTRGCDVNQTEKIRVNINVPPIPPTDFSTSNIVKVRYAIRIIGSVACCHCSPELELPITIGSYPIQDNPYQYSYQSPHQPTVPDQSGRMDTTYPNNAPTAPSSNDEPPSYAEAVLKNSDDSQFKPKYAMFKRTTSYSSGN